jgi:CMP-N,N'-diacetyllegionaminic acid synthase
VAIIGIVPARGGSKGIVGKNLVSCGGRPLIAYTFDAARGAASLDRVLLSTDSPEIAACAREYGVEVPFVRPADLAGDDVPMAAVVRHALAWLEAEGTTVDGLVLLQPTSPLRQSVHIDDAVAHFRERAAASVVSVVEVPHHCNPVSVMVSEGGLLRPFLAGAAILRRQDKPRVWARNGPAVLVMRPSTVRGPTLYGEPCVGYEMDRQSSIDVDTRDDLELAEWLLKRRRAAGGCTLYSDVPGV